MEQARNGHFAARLDAFPYVPGIFDAVAVCVLPPVIPKGKAGFVQFGFDRHAHVYPCVTIMGGDELQGFADTVKIGHHFPTSITTTEPGVVCGLIFLSTPMMKASRAAR